jgi:hypothetical protein
MILDIGIMKRNVGKIMTTLKEHLLIWPALIFLGSCLFGLLYGINSIMPNEKVYNCQLAEISPDFTTAMREECRKLRINTQK